MVRKMVDTAPDGLRSVWIAKSRLSVMAWIWQSKPSGGADHHLDPYMIAEIFLTLCMEYATIIAFLGMYFGK